MAWASVAAADGAQVMRLEDEHLAPVSGRRGPRSPVTVIWRARGAGELAAGASMSSGFGHGNYSNSPGWDGSNQAWFYRAGADEFNSV